MGRLFLASVGLACSIASMASGQSVVDELQCSRTIAHDTEYSSGGNVRADQISLCISQDGSKAALLYRASAMHNSRFVGSNNSPWLRLALLDGQGTEIFRNDNFDLVEVDRCGGYAARWAIVPMSADDVDRIQFMRISIGNVGPRSCDPSPEQRLATDLTDTAKRWATGDLNEDEREILSLVQGGGF